MKASSDDLILAIDQGTTSTKVLLMNTQLSLVAEKSTPFEQHFPKPGWVEHDLEQIWKTVEMGIEEVLRKSNSKKIIAIGITNQRETLCFWNKKTGQSLGRAIVWQDRRTSERCEAIRAEGWEPKIQEKTGLLIDPYFSSSKLEWALKNIPQVQSAAADGTLAVGTIDSFLLACLTGFDAHATETSNASRTQLCNIQTLKWDADLLKLFGVSATILPEIKSSFCVFGKTKGVKGLPDGIPISGILGDQQAALLGQACIHPGQAKCTYGTGAFLLMNTGTQIRKSTHRLLSTIAWTDRDGKTIYALEGSAFMAGATIQWLRDGLQMITRSDEIEALASSVPSTDGVVLVPAFTGLGAPYWNPHARASISGLTRGSTRAHIARAALEGIAFQNADILRAMEKDLGESLKELRVDGGACKNNLLMQMQADFLDRGVRRPQFIEATSLGAVFAAGLGAGIWTTMDEIEKIWKLDREFLPKMKADERVKRLKEWQTAVGFLS